MTVVTLSGPVEVSCLSGGRIAQQSLCTTGLPSLVGTDRNDRQA